MAEMGEPQIENHQGEDYTRVTFRPDFQKFGVSKFSEDMINLMKRRVYDIAGIIKVKVYLNGKLVKIPNFREYAKMYIEDPEEAIVETKERNGRWHVIVSPSDG